MSSNNSLNGDPPTTNSPPPWLFEYPARVRFPVYDGSGKIMSWWTQLYTNLYQVPPIKVLFEPDLALFIQDRPEGVIEYLDNGQWKKLIFEKGDLRKAESESTTEVHMFHSEDIG